MDTLSRTYSWTGEYRENAYQGEGVPTLAEFKGYTFAGVANLTYNIGDQHFFTLNDTYTHYRRRTTNSAANSVQQIASTFMRRINQKNVLGLSYKFLPNEHWNMVAFLKYYNSLVKGPVNVATSGRADYVEQERSTDALGWGAAGTYFLLGKDLQLKLSYERTYRLPTDRELFGDGASEEGLGSKQAGLRSYKIENGMLKEITSPVKVEAFGNTGTFGTYSYAAQISKPYAMVIDNSGAGKNVAVNLPAYAIDEDNPNISNIVDMGNNQVAMVLNYSTRDSAVVAICDSALNIKKVIYDDRIGTSVGAQRSVRYTQSGMDDKGNIYVFSGSSATDSKVGALRINKGATEFDKNYKFDILSASGGYRFRKAFHISGSKFLLEFYLDKEKYGNMDASGKMAVVDMDAKSLTWVTGLPDASTVSFGWGDGYAGAYYLPVAAATSFSGGSGNGGSGNGGGWNHGGNSGAKALSSYITRADATTSTVVPTIYKIDANTGVATAFMTFGNGDLLKAITILK